MSAIAPLCEALDGEVIPPTAPVTSLVSQAQIEAFAGEVRAEHEAGERSLNDAVKHFMQCGVLLLKAKAEMGHGGFGHFLKHAARLHPRTAQRYMLLARELPKLPRAKATRVSQLSLRDAVAELSRLSSKVAKLPAPVLDRALVEARHEPLKKAVTKAFGAERNPRAVAKAITMETIEAPPAPVSSVAQPARSAARSADDDLPDQICLIVNRAADVASKISASHLHALCSVQHLNNLSASLEAAKDFLSALHAEHVLHGDERKNAALQARGVAAPPPATLIESILGHLYLYTVQHPGTEPQAILAALDEVKRLVQTGALLRLGGAR